MQHKRCRGIHLHSPQSESTNQCTHLINRSITGPPRLLARKRGNRVEREMHARLLLRRTSGSTGGSLSSLLALPAAVVLGLAATEEGHPPSVDERRGRVWPVGGGAALMEAAPAPAPAAAGEKQQKRVTAASLAGRSNQQSPHPCSQKGHFVKGERATAYAQLVRSVGRWVVGRSVICAVRAYETHPLPRTPTPTKRKAATSSRSFRAGAT